MSPPQKITLKRVATAELKLAVQLQPGYHVNSNTPAEDYLIPLRLSWQPGGLRAVDIVYPKPRLENYEFSDKPVSVFTGNFEIVTKFKPEPKADLGPGVLAGKLRYQACNNTTCFPPKTVDIKLPFSIQ